MAPGEIQGTLAAVCDGVHQITATGEVRSADEKWDFPRKIWRFQWKTHGKKTGTSHQIITGWW